MKFIVSSYKDCGLVGYDFTGYTKWLARVINDGYRVEDSGFDDGSNIICKEGCETFAVWMWSDEEVAEYTRLSGKQL